MPRPTLLALVPFAFAIAALAAAAQCRGDARSLFQERKLDAARAAVEAQLKQNSTDAAALYCMGRIEYAEGRSGKAVDWFEKAIKIDDTNAANHLWLGNALGDEAQKASKFRQPFSRDA